MRKLKPVLLVTLMVVFFNSCVSIDFENDVFAENEEEVFNVNDFDAVDLGSAMDVVIIPSSSFKVTANGSAKDLNDLNVRVVNNTLKVSFYDRNIFRAVNRNKVELLIEMPDLLEADISGAATVRIVDFTYFADFKVDIGGASKLTFDVPTGELNAEISGASTLTLRKEIPIIKADLSGASKLNAYDADSEEAYLELSGASKANVAVKEYLKVDASGASTVNYRGIPRIEQDLSGASKVNKD